MTSKFIFMPSFERSVKQIKKRYQHIKDDLATVLEALETNPSSGTVIPRDYGVRKMRVASRDMQRGKSGGFRLLYLISARDEEGIIIYLLLVYAKTEQSDVTIEQLKQLVENTSDEDD